MASFTCSIQESRPLGNTNIVNSVEWSWCYGERSWCGGRVPAGRDLFDYLKRILFVSNRGSRIDKARGMD